MEPVREAQAARDLDAAPPTDDGSGVAPAAAARAPRARASRVRARVSQGAHAILRTWVAHRRLLLVVAALLPLVPTMCRFLRDGIPDIVATGDAGLLEMRTLFAARGTELLGPYSRFQWSHPGPAFFYLALPIYELFRQREPALHLFVFVVNAICVWGIVSVARRTGGNAFAGVVVALLAILVAGTHFPLSTIWNPHTPELPLVMMSLLCARLAVGDVDVLPLFIFAASAIVQTHVGYVPVTFVLCALGAAFFCWHCIAVRSHGARVRWRSVGAALWPVVAAILMLLVMWALPVYENATTRNGNLTRLWRFFTDGHAPDHSWPAALAVVAERLAEIPFAVVRVVAPSGFAAATDPMISMWLAGAEVVALVLVFVIGVRRRARAVAAMAVVALGEIAAAVMAVRAIRGGLYDYLTSWIVVVGFVSWVAIAGGAIEVAARQVRARALGVGVAAGTLLTVVVAVVVGLRELPPPAVPDRDAEVLAREITSAIVGHHIDRPVVRIVAPDRWPITAGIVVALLKHHVPVLVSDDLVFLFGRQLAQLPDDRREHPILLIGDQTLGARLGKNCQLVAASGDTAVYLEDPGYARSHAYAGPVTLLSASGAIGDPSRAVDGVVPEPGTKWDAPLSVVLGVASVNELEVAVPAADVNGVALWVDGNDRYDIWCHEAGGKSTLIGTTPLPVKEIGMRQRLVFSDTLMSCRSISIGPSEGDGFYSVAEIGFLTRAAR